MVSVRTSLRTEGGTATNIALSPSRRPPTFGFRSLWRLASVSSFSFSLRPSDFRGTSQLPNQFQRLGIRSSLTVTALIKL